MFQTSSEGGCYSQRVAYRLRGAAAGRWGGCVRCVPDNHGPPSSPARHVVVGCRIRYEYFSRALEQRWREFCETESLRKNV